MAGSGDQIKALVRSHASGDDASFYAVALQVAAQAARQGHHLLADDLRKAVDASRRASGRTNVTKLPSSREDIEDLVSVENPTVKLSHLVLPAAVKAQLKQVLVEQRQRKSLESHGFVPSHRLLLEGPPGTGKTMTAAALATELDLPLLTVRLDTLVSKYMGETASKLRAIFDSIATRRSVYLFDEFDAIGGDRSGNDVGEARRTLNSFLLFLEQSNSESLVVASTNHRAILDRALFRRFDVVITYGLPRKRDATMVMKRRLGSLANEIDWQRVIYAQEMSHAELVKAAEQAAKLAIMAGQTSVTTDLLNNALGSRKVSSVG